jgi:transposase
MSISATTSPKTRGRKPDANSTSGKIRTLLASGMEPGEIAKKLGCSASLVYNVKARTAGGGKKAKRGPGRPAKSSAPAAAMDGLAGIVEMVRKSEAERARLHGALTKMAAILREALA